MPLIHRVSTHRRSFLCALILLTLAAPRTRATAADAPGRVPVAHRPATAMPISRLPKRRPGLLLTTLGLAGGLIGMERLASWRLNARQHRAMEMEASLLRALTYSSEDS